MASKVAAGKINFELTQGARNLLLRESGLFSNFNTPAQTKTNANNVPIEHKFKTTSLGMQSVEITTTIPAMIVALEGVR